MPPELPDFSIPISPRDRLTQAAERSITGTIALSIDAKPWMLQIRVCSCSDDRLHLAVPLDLLPTLHGKVVAGASATISLRDGNDELYFTTDVRRFEVDAAGELMLVVSLPTQIATTQRRRGFRVLIDADDAIVGRIWRLEKYASIRDRPLPSTELPAEILDLGVGGMRAIIRPRGQYSLNLHENDRLRVQIVIGKHDVVLEGKLRHPRETARDDEQAICGIRFVDRDDLDSRRAFHSLQLVLADLQRSAARRRNVA